MVIYLNSFINLLKKSVLGTTIVHFIDWFSADSKVIASTLAFFTLCVFIPSNKIFFVLSSLYILAVFFFTRSWKLTLLYVFIPLSQFGIGQSYVFNLIPAHILKHPLYPDGRNAYYAFTPYTALGLSMVIWVACAGIKKYGSFLWGGAELAAAVSILLQTISAAHSTYVPHLSVLYALNSVFLLAYVMLLRIVLLPSRIHARTVTASLIALATLCIFFQTGLAILQYIKRSPVGLKIEVANELPYFGAGADEDSSQVRPVGLTSHANIFAFELLNLWAFTVVLWIASGPMMRKNISNVVLIGGAVGSIGIILSQSRSGYLGWLLLSGCFFFVLFRFEKKLYASVLAVAQKMKIGIIALIPIATYVTIMRILYTLESFNPHAGAGTRTYLLREATELILKHPVWGVGIGMFIPAAFEQQVTQVMTYFPEAVHNGFVLLLVEQGLLVCFSVVVLYVLLVRSIYEVKNVPLSILAIGSIFSVWCCMLFQPFSAILPMAVVGIFAARYVSKIN